MTYLPLMFYMTREDDEEVGDDEDDDKDDDEDDDSGQPKYRLGEHKETSEEFQVRRSACATARSPFPLHRGGMIPAHLPKEPPPHPPLPALRSHSKPQP